jgi:hypothetical protein
MLRGPAKNPEKPRSDSHCANVRYGLLALAYIPFNFVCVS